MTYIIAEVGSNWRDFTEAKDSISLAKNLGADAVKFQFFKHDELFGFSSIKKIYDDNTGQIEAIDNGDNKFELPVSWLPKLKEKADACGIDFMCTAFSPDGLKTVDPFVKAHKIASCELNYWHLLDAARRSGKPVYLSVGASSFGDIFNALSVLRDKREDEALAPAEVTLMYCSVEYPSTWHNLRIINTLRDQFKLKVGYSDHSLDIYTPVTAVHVHGAVAIEKHFKLKDMDTPDSPHSLGVEKFQHMVELIRDQKAVMKMPNPGERAAVIRHKRRLVVTRDIKEGEAFKYGDNFGIFRSLKDDTNGLGGFAWASVDGRLAKRTILAGEPIGPSDI